jgi:hypothetical protein
MRLDEYRHDLNQKHVELATQFPNGYCYVMSLAVGNSTAGSVSEVSVLQAARLALEGTHRLATAEEIDAFHVTSRARQCQFDVAELQRKGSFRVTLTKDKPSHD